MISAPPSIEELRILPPQKSKLFTSQEKKIKLPAYFALHNLEKVKSTGTVAPQKWRLFKYFVPPMDLLDRRGE